jgi:hypothetical protein
VTHPQWRTIVASEGFFIDHVIYGVVDIDAAAERLRRDYGLGSVPGGQHLGGTTNRIVPLAPPIFLELLGIGDTSLSDGAWLEQTLQGRDRVLWWALGCNDLDDTAARRGLPIQAGQMQMGDGSEAVFRTAGMSRYPLPFFVANNMTPEALQQRWAGRFADAAHDNIPEGYTFVEVGEPAEFISSWLGDHDLPVRHASVPGRGITRVGISTARGEIILD